MARAGSRSARDTEVLHWRLRDLVATQPGELVLGPVGARVALELRDRHRAGKPARTQLPALVGRAAGRVDRAARAVAHDRTPQERNQGLPEVRKSAKRARYAAEAAVPVSGKPARRLAEAMEAPQDVLGEHQDSVAAPSLLRELAMAAQASGENGCTFGLLYGQERTRANDARRNDEPALRKASTTRARRWTQ